MAGDHLPADGVADQRKPSASQAVADGLGPAGDPDRHAIQLHVQDALERLEATSREIVTLHYFSGLSYDEIGRALGLSTQSVHGRLQRARGKLARILDARDSSGAKT